MNATSNWLAPVLRNRMVMFILAMAILVPLAFAPVSAHNPALGAVLLEGCAIVLLAMLLLRADWRGGIGNRVVEFIKAPTNLPALLFLAVAGASILMAPANARDFGIQEFLRIGSGVVLYFAIAHHIRRSDQLSCLTDVVLFLSCVISIAGFVHLNSAAGNFATGLFGDHQLYGSCVMALLPVAAAVAVTEKKSLGRQLFAQSATVLAAAALLVSHSRGAWIGGGAALSVLVVTSFAQMMKKQRSSAHLHLKEVAVPVVLLVMAVGFFLVLWPNTSTMLGRAASLNSVQSDATWNTRQYTWAGAEKMIMQSPIVGHGLGMWPVMSHQYAGVGLPIADMHVRPSLSEQAHNLYLQTAAEVGILGLVLFLAIPGTLLFLGVRRAMTMDDGIRKTLLLGAMASTVGILVDAIASPSWQMGTVSLFMWLILGIVASCMQPNAKRERVASLELVKQPKARPAFAFGSLALGFLLPTAALAAIPGYNHVVSVRIQPTADTINAGSSETFQLFATFANDAGQVGAGEQDVTAAAGTTFSFSTSNGNLGFLVGTNGSTYTSSAIGNYTAFVTGTFNDGLGGSASATSTIRVLAGSSNGNDVGLDATLGGVGAGLLFWLLAHHGSGDSIDFDAGGNNRNSDAKVDTGLSNYGQSLPDDSLFNTGKSAAGNTTDGKSGQ